MARSNYKEKVLGEEVSAGEIKQEEIEKEKEVMIVTENQLILNQLNSISTMLQELLKRTNKEEVKKEFE